MTTENITGTRRRQVGLGQAVKEFVRHPSPWMMASIVVGALVARIVVGDWRVSDLWAPLAFVAVFPLIEWVIHVFVLHWRPRRVGRVTLDTLLARKHRAHHADPRDVPLVFIPWQTMIGLMVVTPILPLLLFPRVGQALTFVLTMGLAGMVYEWTHYLIHTDYKPRSRTFKAVYRHHRLHHFKNENYWLTVTTSGTADRLLGTNPDPATVPTSPTAKNLHGVGA
jgi:hypothetical protein